MIIIIKIDLNGGANNVAEKIETGPLDIMGFHEWKHAIFYNNEIFVYAKGGIYIYDLNNRMFLGQKENVFNRKSLFPVILTGKYEVTDSAMSRKDGIGFFATEHGVLVVDLDKKTTIDILKVEDKHMWNAKVAIHEDSRTLYISSRSSSILYVVKYNL